MNDAQLLERLTSADPYGPGASLPRSAWSADAAWSEVERLARVPGSPSRARRGWLVAAAAFAVVLLIGVGVTLVARTVVDDRPVADTTLPRVTTTAPPTTEAAVPVPPDSETVIAGFIDAYNNADVATASGQLASNATVDFAAWVETNRSPSVRSLDARIQTGAIFEESTTLGGCEVRAGDVACTVSIADFFTEHLALDASTQTWVFTFDGTRIASLAVESHSGPRTVAMTDFDAWLQSHGSNTVLAGDGEWIRTEATAEMVRAELVEYGALASGVATEDWNVVDAFYRSLSDGDVPAALGLFAAGGTYDLAENDDINVAPVLERGGPVADPDIRQQFIWWYDYLKVDWQPLRCVAGVDAGEVRCRSAEVGVTTLPFPGGVVQGLLVFEIGDDGIDRVVDHTLRGTDLRNWWRDWLEPNAPQYVDVWLTPTGPGQGEAPMTEDFANVTLELYPQYLAERRVDVPPEYLNGSLLPDDWVPRPAP